MHVLYFNWYHQTVLGEVVITSSARARWLLQTQRSYGISPWWLRTSAHLLSWFLHPRKATQCAHPMTSYHLSSFWTGHPHPKALAHCGLLVWANPRWPRCLRLPSPVFLITEICSPSPTPCIGPSPRFVPAGMFQTFSPAPEGESSWPQAGPIKRGSRDLHSPGRALRLYRACSTSLFFNHMSF